MSDAPGKKTSVVQKARASTAAEVRMSARAEALDVLDQSPGMATRASASVAATERAILKQRAEAAKVDAAI